MNESVKALKDAAKAGLKVLEKKKGVKQAEIFVANNELTTMRLCYATNIPCNGLEEPKSRSDYGLSARILFDDGKIGFGKYDAGIGRKAVEQAFEKARKNAVHDPDFHSLPEPGKKAKLSNYHDKKIFSLKDEKAADLSYACLQGALDVLSKKKFGKNFTATGEVNFLKEKIAIANTNGILEQDENTIALCTLTTILELEKDVSGMWFDSSTKLKGFNPYNAGKVSAEKALDSVKAESIDSGTYRIVMGRQAVADLLSNNFSPTLSSVDARAAPFTLDDLGKQYASEKLTIYDDALMPDTIGTKRITDEGLATSKTTLVENGVFTNFLSNDYYTRKYAKKGKKFPPTNGFRFGGGGRHYNSQPGVSATNLVVKEGNYKDEELVKEIKDGVYIGRIWYTYPVNGSTSSDFSSTIRGDSYIIKNGEKKTGLVPNTMRINDNLQNLLKGIVGLGRKKLPSLVWGAEEVVVCPEIAFEKIRLERIAKGLY